MLERAAVAVEHRPAQAQQRRPDGHIQLIGRRVVGGNGADGLFGALGAYPPAFQNAHDRPVVDDAPGRQVGDRARQPHCRHRQGLVLEETQALDPQGALVGGKVQRLKHGGRRRRLGFIGQQPRRRLKPQGDEVLDQARHPAFLSLRLIRARGDEGADAMLASNPAFAFQQIQRAPHRHARHVIGRRQLHFGRQRLLGRKGAVLDLLTQNGGQLVVDRQAAGTAVRLEAAPTDIGPCPGALSGQAHPPHAGVRACVVN